MVERYRRSMHNEFLSDLRAVAVKAVGEVPWKRTADGKAIVEAWNDEEPVVCRRPGKYWRANWEETAAYLELANPAAIVVLIDEVMSHRKQRVRLVSQSTLDVFEALGDDLLAREAIGFVNHGKPLLANDGRDWLQEAYEEALDQAVYLKAALMEREAKDVRREGPPVPKYPLPRDYAFGGGLMDRDDVWAGIGLAVAASLFALGFLVGGH